MIPTPLFSGEVQFRRYSDTSTQGQQIVLQVASRADLEPFIGKEGKRFMAVLVEIGDDEQPVEPRAAEKPKGGELSKWAALRCKEWQFFEFIRPIYDRAMGGDGSRWGDVHPTDFKDENEGYCKHAICVLCDIQSRAELDTDPAAKAKFDRLIRGPYSKWITAQAVPA